MKILPRDEDWAKKCQHLAVEGNAGRGRKEWLECVNKGMKELGLKVDDAKTGRYGEEQFLVKCLIHASTKNQH